MLKKKGADENLQGNTFFQLNRSHVVFSEGETEASTSSNTVVKTQKVKARVKLGSRKELWRRHTLSDVDIIRQVSLHIYCFEQLPESVSGLQQTTFEDVVYKRVFGQSLIQGTVYTLLKKLESEMKVCLVFNNCARKNNQRAYLKSWNVLLTSLFISL